MPLTAPGKTRLGPTAGNRTNRVRPGLYTQPLMRRTQPATVVGLAAGLLALVSIAACTASAPSDTQDAGPAAEVADDPIAPQPTFINLLPWGKVDFTRGQFASMAECNTFVRALPNYSGYTTAERCQPIDDPVYCTGWQDNEGDHLDCFKGVGGCEVELKRHDLLAESGTRTIATRCEPSPLEDAWTRYQADVKAKQ